jgi:hypothetical protein
LLFEKVKKPAPTNLSVKAKASFNAISYSKVSDDQFVEFVLNRYTSSANATANISPIEVYRGPNTRFHDVNADGGMAQDGDYWYRHFYVDLYGNESNLSTAVTAKYSGQKFADLIGQLVAAQLADASLTTAKFAAGITPTNSRSCRMNSISSRSAAKMRMPTPLAIRPRRPKTF